MRSIRTTRTIQALSGAAIVAAGMAAFMPTAAHAAVACNEQALVDAVTATNAAGGGTITLTAGCTYTLTGSHSGGDTDGPDGLPVITTAITFDGNANTITRGTGASAFRIAKVASNGNLTFKSVTVSGGSAQGAGLVGNGGGILNRGAVTFTGSTLSGNTAQGLGGALYNTNTATFTSSFVNTNTANQAAGIATTVNGTLTITSTAVNANTAAVNPGGIYSDRSNVTLNTSTVTANTPTDCAGSPSPVPGCTT